MPRSRKRKSSNTVVESPTSTTTTTHTKSKGQVHIVPLTQDQIRAIYAKRRTKGLYGQFLTQFMESGDNGTDVKETWPQLADKKATTIKQGFENAKEKKDAPEGSEAVDVIVDGEDVFLINASQLSPELTGAVEE